mmetsp:Transcript_8534/g.12066  ORF Transcript_8534/g.12066 Transcript_8534/m.12066 type:complete len:249 (+) Transcript_8534:128-874(+)
MESLSNAPVSEALEGMSDSPRALNIHFIDDAASVQDHIQISASNRNGVLNLTLPAGLSALPIMFRKGQRKQAVQPNPGSDALGHPDSDASNPSELMPATASTGINQPSTEEAHTTSFGFATPSAPPPPIPAVVPSFSTASAQNVHATSKDVATLFSPTGTTSSLGSSSSISENREKKRKLQTSQSLWTPSTEAKFECVACLKVFKTRYRLRRHFTSHTGERPYPCDICGARFRQKSHRKGHRAKVHKM